MPQLIDSDFIDRLTAQSALAEVPSYDMTLDLSLKGEALGATLDRHPDLPGVVIRDGEAVLGVISRGQYLRLIGRQFGREVFHPRPLKLLWEAVDSAEEPLVLADSTPIQEAVAQALGRPRELIYEPVIVTAPDASGIPMPRLVDFPDLLRADSRISALRNQQMQQILSTVQEGFLLVDTEYRIASEYSASIETILAGRQLTGRPLPEVLAEHLGAERAELARDYLGTLFNPNVIERLVTQINPLARVEATAIDGRERHLSFRFLRGVDDGVIRRVLVRIEDITREVELAAELEAQEQRAEERVELIFEIVGVDGEALATFLSGFERRLAEIATLLDPGDRRDIDGRLAAVFRHAHGLKGEAGLLGLRRFQDRIHRFEDRIGRVREAGILAIDALPELREGWSDLEGLLEETRAVIGQFQRLGRFVDGAPVDGAAVAAADATPSTSAAPPPSAEAPAPGPVGLFDHLAVMVEDLGRRLGKPARFVARCDELEIPERYRALVREAAAQFARNSVVHGLEAAELRRERGKPELGTLQFALRRHPDRGQIELIFQDDGGGLDLEAIRRRGAELGMTSEQEPEVFRWIFSSGFSTVDEATHDAGRGVGLDVVHDRVRAAGGSVLPHSKPGVFCAFQILLPLPEVVS